MTRALAILFAVLVSLPAAGEPAAAPMPGTGGSSVLGPFVEVLEDPGRRLDLEQVRQDPRFKPNATETADFGHTRSAWWLRFRIYGGWHPGGDLLLEAGYPGIDRMELHAPPGGGPALQRAGDSWAWGDRQVKHRNHVFRLTVPKAPGAHDYYLRVESRDSLTVPLTLWLPAAYERHNYQAQLALGFCYGLLAAMLIYNLMVWLWLRDRSRLHYVIYTASCAVYLLCQDGLAFEFFWPDSVWWANRGAATSLAIALAFGALFSSEFLGMRRIAPLADRLLRGIAAAALVLSLSAASGWPVEHGHVLRAIAVLAFAAAAIGVPVALRAFGGGPARFFLPAWGALLLSAVLPHVGVVLNALLLSFALARRVKS